MAIRGYHRGSTKDQHLDRGISEIEAYYHSKQLSMNRIYTDKMAGRNCINEKKKSSLLFLRFLLKHVLLSHSKSPWQQI